jgi:hypothetical protein
LQTPCTASLVCYQAEPTVVSAMLTLTPEYSPGRFHRRWQRGRALQHADAWDSLSPVKVAEAADPVPEIWDWGLSQLNTMGGSVHWRRPLDATILNYDISCVPGVSS